MSSWKRDVIKLSAVVLLNQTGQPPNKNLEFTINMRFLIVSALLYLLFGVFLFPLASYSQSDVKTNRFVKSNTIVSDKLPKIKIEVGKDFVYVGRFNFKIRDVAGGERFVFVEAKDKKVKRMFVAQFEGFFKHIDNYFRYSFKDALKFGKHKFRHNSYAFSNKESYKNNPKGEANLTKVFLNSKGYLLEDELMMYRYITVPDAEKKHELILFYFENVSETGNTLSDFYENDRATNLWKRIAMKLMNRSLATFKVK